MCTFLTQNGCDITDMRNIVYIFSYSVTDNIFEHIISFYSDVNIIDELENYLSKISFSKIKILVEKGYMIDKIDLCESNWCKKIVSYNISNLEFLIDHGLKMVNNILYYAVKTNNIKLVKYLVSYGLVFDKYVTYDIFTTRIKYKMNSIKILSNYDFDMSLVEQLLVNNENPYIKFMNNGTNMEILFNALF